MIFGKASGFADIDLENLSAADGFRVIGSRGYDRAGFSVSSAGDINGDGFDDIIVGAKWNDAGGTNAGAAWVIYGSAGGFGTIDLGALTDADGFKIMGDADGDLAGVSVSAAGDLNGDGFDDVIVGATENDAGGTNAGAAYIIYGQAPTASVTRIGSSIGQTIRGGEFNDTLDGRAGDDSLFGAGGGDILIGGADIMHGGAGNDTYDVDEAGDQVIENAGEGTDHVRSSISYTLAANLEKLTLTGTAAIDGTGNALANVIAGNGGENVLRGQGGNDVLDGKGRNDTLFGAGGNDTIEGGANGDFLDGGGGDDDLTGGLGNDTYLVGSPGDTVVENLNEGVDKVRSFIDWTLGDNVEKLQLVGTDSIDGTGNSLNNSVIGNSAANVLSGLGGNDNVNGGDGNDTLDGGTGVDKLAGGAGDDTLIGGADRDVLFGGAGADSFVFRDGDLAGLTPATADRFNDFSSADGDTIGLSAVDANTLLGGDQEFSFVGTSAFSNTAGELRYENVGGYTYVYGDTNGDGVADFMITMVGTHALTGGDFVI